MGNWNSIENSHYRFPNYSDIIICDKFKEKDVTDVRLLLVNSNNGRLEVESNIPLEQEAIYLLRYGMGRKPSYIVNVKVTRCVSFNMKYRSRMEIMNIPLDLVSEIENLKTA